MPPNEEKPKSEKPPTQATPLNWPVVMFGGLLLVLAVAAIPDRVFSAIAAAAILGLTFFWAQSRQETEVENPLLDHLRAQQPGLDRRKYGRLRSSTDRLLDHVRSMNRIAIDGREGKLAPRHAHAELDRLAAMMRDLIDEIRKSAGIPTPVVEPGEKAAQPQVVLPKARQEAAPEAKKSEPKPPDEEADASEDELEKLIVAAEAEAKARREAKSKSAEASDVDEAEDAADEAAGEDDDDDAEIESKADETDSDELERGGAAVAAADEGEKEEEEEEEEDEEILEQEVEEEKTQ